MNAGKKFEWDWGGWQDFLVFAALACVLIISLARVTASGSRADASEDRMRASEDRLDASVRHLEAVSKGCEEKGECPTPLVPRWLRGCVCVLPAAGSDLQ